MFSLELTNLPATNSRASNLVGCGCSSLLSTQHPVKLQAWVADSVKTSVACFVFVSLLLCGSNPGKHGFAKRHEMPLNWTRCALVMTHNSTIMMKERQNAATPTVVAIIAALPS